MLDRIAPLRTGGYAEAMWATAKPDVRERIVAPLLRLLGPLMRRVLRTGLPAGPNVLLTVRGRTSGKPRTTPVAMLVLGDRRFVQASFGQAAWVRNLRASGSAVVTRGGRSEPVQATELSPEEGGALMHDALAPYRRSRLLRALLGPTVRPPVAVLHRFRFRIDDELDVYVAEATRHPLFELASHSPGEGQAAVSTPAGRSTPG